MSSLVIGTTGLTAVENLAALLTVHAATAPLAAEWANPSFLQDRQAAEDGGTGLLLVHPRSEHDDVALFHVLHAAAVHFLDVKGQWCTAESGNPEASVGVGAQCWRGAPVDIQTVADIAGGIEANVVRFFIIFTCRKKPRKQCFNTLFQPRKLSGFLKTILPLSVSNLHFREL